MSSSPRLFAVIVFVLLAAVLVLVGGLLAPSQASSPPGRMVTDTAPSSPATIDFTVTTTAATEPSSSTATTEPVKPAQGSASLPASLPEDGPTVHVPILMYHYVDDEPPAEMGPYADSLTVRTPEFEAQAAYIESQGIRAIGFPELYLALAGTAPLSGPSVILTFDDGGADLYTKAFPILKKHKLTATFFIITDEIGKPGYLTWEQIVEMKEAGMSIESHTKTHPDLPSASDAQLQAELVESSQAIEKYTGQASIVLSYPAGSYDDRVVSAAREAGYLMAVTTNAGKEESSSECFAMPRVRIQPGFSTEAFAQKVE